MQDRVLTGASGAGEGEDRGQLARAGERVGEQLEVDEVGSDAPLAVELGRTEDVLEADGDVEEALLSGARQGQVEGDGGVAVRDAGGLAGERVTGRRGVHPVDARDERDAAGLEARDDELDGVRVVRGVAGPDVAERAGAIAEADGVEGAGPDDAAAVVSDGDDVGRVGHAVEAQRRHGDGERAGRRARPLRDAAGDGRQEQPRRDNAASHNILPRGGWLGNARRGPSCFVTLPGFQAAAQ